ncbi:PAS domain-containing protein [Salegentibacter sp. JZCK2]|uniref:PAS domain-containing protein n=1 Tax=Salegentibacter tibetensis TaxID=2873600 RepID=UPI001CCDD6A8|nr:PAS domain-containing protein [Salegentibacter tibetensis]MBZ9728660.1 PAS domain-containing protein [Salegentibacter tibetensis]
MVGNKFIIVNATDAYCKLANTSREFLIGKQVPEAFPNDSEANGKRIEASFNKAILTGEPEQIEILRYDLTDPDSGEKEEKYWQIQSFAVSGPAAENSIYIWNIIVDKTAEIFLKQRKKELETEKKQRTEQDRFFIEGNSDALYSLDREGNFLSINEGLLELTETSEEELLQMDFLPFCAQHDRERTVSFFKKAVAGEPQRFEGDFVSAKGRKMILSIDLLPMKVDGEVLGAYGIAKDITSLRTSEKDLNQKKEFLDLYSRIIDLLVAHGVESVNLEYIFGEIGQTSDADVIYYLGESLEDLDEKPVISEIIQWRRKSVKTEFSHPDLSWSEKLKKLFGPFQYDAPQMLEPDNCHTREQRELLKENGIKSLIILPVFINNELFGLVGIENRFKKRVWQTEEQEFLRSILKNVVSFVEKRISNIETRRKKQELLKTEKKFEFLVQEGLDLIGILEADGTYKFVGASSSRVLGISPQEFVGRNAFDFIHPEDKDFMFAQFSSISSRKHLHIQPFRFRNAKGQWRWIETTATNLLEAPEIEGIITNSRDVTEKFERAREIKDLNDRYRLAAKATHDLMYDWDLVADEVTRYIEGKESMFGYSLEKMEEISFWREQIHPEDRHSYIKELKAALKNFNASKMNTQYRFQRSDGSYASIIDRGHIIRDGNGKAIRLIGATSDISEIISNRDALKLANVRFNYAMKATREMIWDWNIKDDIIIRSKAFKKLYGYDEDKHSVEDFWFDKIVQKDRERVKKSLYAAVKNPKVSEWKEEYRFLKLSGEKAFVIDRGFIIRDATGKATRMVGATLDVSESRKLVKEIKKQNKVLREIAWEQAHVVRAPLTRLKGLVELVKLEVYDEWSQKELIDLISDSADELDEVVIKIIRKTEEV